MYKYIVHWYDQDEIIKTEETPILAESRDKAIVEAFKLYNGKPPAPLVYLEEVAV